MSSQYEQNSQRTYDSGNQGEEEDGLDVLFGRLTSDSRELKALLESFKENGSWMIAQSKLLRERLTETFSAVSSLPQLSQAASLSELRDFFAQNLPTLQTRLDSMIASEKSIDLFSKKIDSIGGGVESQTKDNLQAEELIKSTTEGSEFQQNLLSLNSKLQSQVTMLLEQLKIQAELHQQQLEECANERTREITRLTQQLRVTKVELKIEKNQQLKQQKRQKVEAKLVEDERARVAKDLQDILAASTQREVALDRQIVVLKASISSIEKTVLSHPALFFSYKSESAISNSSSSSSSSLQSSSGVTSTSVLEHLRKEFFSLQLTPLNMKVDLLLQLISKVSSCVSAAEVQASYQEKVKETVEELLKRITKVVDTNMRILHPQTEGVMNLLADISVWFRGLNEKNYWRSNLSDESAKLNERINYFLNFSPPVELETIKYDLVGSQHVTAPPIDYFSSASTVENTQTPQMMSGSTSPSKVVKASHSRNPSTSSKSSQLLRLSRNYSPVQVNHSNELSPHSLLYKFKSAKYNSSLTASTVSVAVTTPFSVEQTPISSNSNTSANFNQKRETFIQKASEGNIDRVLWSLREVVGLLKVSSNQMFSSEVLSGILDIRQTLYTIKDSVVECSEQFCKSKGSSAGKTTGNEYFSILKTQISQQREVFEQHCREADVNANEERVIIEGLSTELDGLRRQYKEEIIQKTIKKDEVDGLMEEFQRVRAEIYHLVSITKKRMVKEWQECESKSKNTAVPVIQAELEMLKKTCKKRAQELKLIVTKVAEKVQNIDRHESSRTSHLLSSSLRMLEEQLRLSTEQSCGIQIELRRQKLQNETLIVKHDQFYKQLLDFLQPVQ